MSTIKYVCTNCNYGVEFPKGPLSFRCEKCKIINCMVCKRTHDLACEIFQSEAEAPALQPASSVRRPVSSKPNASVFCETCKKTYTNKYSYKKHQESMLHKRNVLRGQREATVHTPNPIKLEPIERAISYEL